MAGGAVGPDFAAAAAAGGVFAAAVRIGVVAGSVDPVVD